jgi:hypothetical protein
LVKYWSKAASEIDTLTLGYFALNALTISCIAGCWLTSQIA